MAVTAMAVPRLSPYRDRKIGMGYRVVASSIESRIRFATDAVAFIPAAMMTRPAPSTTARNSGESRSMDTMGPPGGAKAAPSRAEVVGVAGL